MLLLLLLLLFFVVVVVVSLDWKISFSYLLGGSFYPSDCIKNTDSWKSGTVLYLLALIYFITFLGFSAYIYIYIYKIYIYFIYIYTHTFFKWMTGIDSCLCGFFFSIIYSFYLCWCQKKKKKDFFNLFFSPGHWIVNIFFFFLLGICVKSCLLNSLKTGYLLTQSVII